MAERRHGGSRGDARGGGRSGGRGDLPNEEAARQRDLRDIEIDDLRQQVRDLQRDIEKGDLRRQVRDLQRRLAQLEERRGKSNPMRSNVSERRSMDDPLFSDVFTSSDADEPSKNGNSNIFSMSVYDTPVYDEDIFYELPGSMPVYDKPVYDEDILSMPGYDKPVYDEDIFYELPGLMSKSPPPSVNFDDAAEEEGVAVDDDEAEGANRLLGFMFGIFDGAGDRQLVHGHAWESDQVMFSCDCEFPDGGFVKIPSNLVVLFLPIGQSVDSLVDYMEMREFNDAFSTVREAFSVWDIHLCWVAVEIEIDKKKIGCGDNVVAIRDVIRKMGWGFCSSNYVILSSVLLPLGLIYPQVGMSLDFADFGGIHRRKYSGELNLEILDGKRFECMFCDLELVILKTLSCTIETDDILFVLTRNLKVEDVCDLWVLARWSQGFVAWYLVELVKDACMIALNGAISSRAYSKRITNGYEAYGKPFTDEELEGLKLTKFNFHSANHTALPNVEMEDFSKASYTNWDDDGDEVDSRTSLFQEGEYDAVLEYMTWRLSKSLFWFYLFPS